MRGFRTVAAVVALVTMAAACGDDAEPVRYSAAQLDTALLAPTDVGAGYQVDDRTGGESRPPGTPAIDPGIWCDAASSTADDLQGFIGPEPVFVQLVSTAVSGRTFHGVSEEMWAADDAQAVVDAADRGFTACTGTEWTSDDGGTASMAALSAGDAGDNSAAALVTYLTEGPDAGYAWRNRVGVVQVGTTVIVVQELDVQQADSPAFMTDAEWQAVLDTAVAKVEALGD
jgi:hypothetical protein